MSKRSLEDSFFGAERPQGEIPPVGEEDFKELLKQAEFHVPKDNFMKPDRGVENKEQIKEIADVESQYDNAKTLYELYQTLVDRDGAVNSSGEHLSADEIMTAILSGNLGPVTRNNGLRRRAQELLLQQEFRFASSMDDIYMELRRRGKIVDDDFGQEYTAEEIIDMIEEKRIEEIPKTNGLRWSVEAILNYEDEK